MVEKWKRNADKILTIINIQQNELVEKCANLQHFVYQLPLNILKKFCLQVTDKDHIVMQQTSDRQHQAIIVMPHSDSIVSTEEFQRSVLSLATNDNIVNDGSLAMMGDDVMNNTVVVTTLEEGSIEDAEEEGEIQVQG